MTQKSNTSYRDKLAAVLKSIAGQTMYISTPRIFFDLTHDLVLAAMISQLVYWSDRATRSDGFVFKSSPRSCAPTVPPPPITASIWMN